MWGGHGNRKFYPQEVKRIEEQLKQSLPVGGYSPKEIEAGYQKLANQFGFFGTLLFMEKETPYKRDELLKWSVGEFHLNLSYIAWRNKVEKRYSELINEKK